MTYLAFLNSCLVTILINIHYAKIGKEPQKHFSLCIFASFGFGKVGAITLSISYFIENQHFR